jgi:hypothetical protein
VTEPKRTRGPLVVAGVFVVIVIFAGLILALALAADPPPPEPAPPGASLVPRQIALPDAGVAVPPGP